ncbi:MAG: ABC transporter ATP-binding protein [Pseudomonadales bacterium]
MNASEQKSESGVFEPWADAAVEPLIRFENVTKKYGDFTAISNLTLDIYEREFYSLLGPSGCGKTTLMRLLAGFETPTSGRILIAGEDISAVPPNKRPVNMMFQSYALFPHMTIEQNIAFGLKQEKRPKREIEQRVREMLELVKLEPFAKRRPEQLSGGQRQRVALARSLAKKPKLLLLDEPLGALDKKLREQTQFELMNLQEELGMTFVIVTHDQEEAMTVSSRIAVMDHGQVMQVATPDMIYEEPSSRYVADFIGDVNFIEARYQGQQDGCAVFASPLQSTLYAETAKTLTDDQQVWLTLRPEKIEISKEKPQGERNVLAGKVWDIAYIGNTSTYHVKLEDGSMIKTQRVNRNRLKKRSITWEDDVWLSWKSDAPVVLTE